MSLLLYISELTRNIEKTELSREEEEFVNSLYEDIKREKERLHVVRDIIERRAPEEYFSLCTLGSIEKLSARLRSDPTFNPQLISTVRATALRALATHYEFPEGVKAETSDLLSAIQGDYQRSPRESYTNFFSFARALSVESQVEMARALLAKGEYIDFNDLNKLALAPLRDRLELARLMIKASQPIYRLDSLLLREAAVEDRVNLLRAIREMGEEQFQEALGYLAIFQSREPKEQFREFLKVCVHRLYLEPLGISLDLDRLQEGEFALSRLSSWFSGPAPEVRRLASQVASLGPLPAIFVSHHPHLLTDLALCESIATQGDRATEVLFDHIPAMQLKSHPFQVRFGLIQTFIKWSRPSRSWDVAERLIKEGFTSEDSVENLIRLYLLMRESNWFSDLKECLKAVFALIPRQGTPAAQLRELIQKEENYARVIIRRFKYFKCSSSPEEIFQLIDFILRVRSNLAPLLAENLKAFFSKKIPIAHRLAAIESLLKADTEAADEILSQLAKLGLEDADPESIFTLLEKSTQGRVRRNLVYFARTLIDKLPVKKRLELAFAVGERRPNDVVEALEYFKLEGCSAEERFRLWDHLIGHGAEVLGFNDKPLQMEGFTAEQSLRLVREMFERNGPSRIHFTRLGLRQAPWQARLEIAKQIIEHQEDTYPYIEAVNEGDFEDLPLGQKFVLLAPAIDKQARERTGEYFINKCLLLLGECNPSSFITLMQLFVRKSPELAARALLQITKKLATPPAVRQVMMEFLVDAPLDLRKVFAHPAVQAVKPLLSLLTLQTEYVQDEVNRTEALPEECHGAIAQLEGFLKEHPALGQLLLPLYEKNEIPKNPPLLRFKLQRWLAYTAGLFFDLTPQQLQAIKASSILDTIYAHPSFEDRYHLVRQLSTFPLFQPGGRQEYGQLASVFLARLGIADAQTQQLTHLVDTRSRFKGAKRLSPLLDLLNEYRLLQGVKGEENGSFAGRLEKILGLETIDQVVGEIQTLANILTLIGREPFFHSLGLSDLDHFFLEAIRKRLPLGDIEDFSGKLKNTFGSSRHPNALFIYLRSIELLPEVQREPTLKLFTQYVAAVVNENFLLSDIVQTIISTCKNYSHLQKLKKDG